MSATELQETQATTLDQITAIVRDVLDADAIELGLDTRPREIEGWDSLANVTIVFSVEESLDVRLGTEALVGLETVGDLVSAVDRSRGRGARVLELL